MLQTLIAKNWENYELIDSGNEEKLERYGHFTFVRPEPKALWAKQLPVTIWQTADAMYRRNNKGGGNWVFKKRVNDFVINWKSLKFSLKPTGFKHVGIFPEQSEVWHWIQSKIQNSKRDINVLNLFAYTGGSTLAAAASGARVTHLDAAKDIVNWASENARLSDLKDKPIRWIVDDAIAFVKREIKRSSKYDAIIMDPPKFGRGPQGEVWKIERDLPKLLQLCRQVLSNDPLLFLMVNYSTEYSAEVMHNMLQQTMKSYGGSIEYGELALQQSSNQFLLPESTFTRWFLP
jgi:23S rRNA (cytosine1962-C5)-methyltransferase